MCLARVAFARHAVPAVWGDAVFRVVNLDDAADTTGAVSGQLAGAFCGESGIPAEWRDGLARRDLIEDALAGLLGERA